MRVISAAVLEPGWPGREKSRLRRSDPCPAPAMAATKTTNQPRATRRRWRRTNEVRVLMAGVLAVHLFPTRNFSGWNRYVAVLYTYGIFRHKGRRRRAVGWRQPWRFRAGRRRPRRCASSVQRRVPALAARLVDGDALPGDHRAPRHRAAPVRHPPRPRLRRRAVAAVGVRRVVDPAEPHGRPGPHPAG